MAYRTEQDLRWVQVNDALHRATIAVGARNSFDAMSKIQEAEIVMRAIRDAEIRDENRARTLSI